MNRSRVAAMLALALSGVAAHADDIVLTPPSGGGVTVTNATATQVRFRILEDGTVTMNGSLFKGAERFLHNSGIDNTFLGLSAGNLSTTGFSNTAIGRNAMLANTTGPANTAQGAEALRSNTVGAENTAVGNSAMGSNVSGSLNTALGALALANNVGGNFNTAVGSTALGGNSQGEYNTAVGIDAMVRTTTGSRNVSLGSSTLVANVAGTDNIALGHDAGSQTLGSQNILLGHIGAAADSQTMRLGAGQTRTFIAGIRGRTTGSANAIAVMIDSNGQLGTVSSSGRFKDDIADMDEASSALMQLRPVTFHYKDDQDREGRTLQYGLVAEEVAEVYPGLVARTPDGQVETVMYQFLPAMLLNEVQKQQRVNEAQSAELALLRRELAEMKQMLRRQP